MYIYRNGTDSIERVEISWAPAGIVGCIIIIIIRRFGDLYRWPSAHQIYYSLLVRSFLPHLPGPNLSTSLENKKKSIRV
jgi:hypothetical protein